MYQKISVRPHQIKVGAGAAVEKGDWVAVGGLKGIATTDSEPDTHEVVILIGGLVGDAFISATGTAIEEGTYLKWDGTLNSNAGGFTNVGADMDDYDAIAGYGVSVDSGETGTGDVWLGL